MYSPCMKCEDREIKCFSKCQRYADFKEELEKIKEKRKLEKDFKCFTYGRYDRVTKYNPNSVTNICIKNKRSA